jgi:hypothetical protein
VYDGGSGSDLTDLELFVRMREDVLCDILGANVRENCHVLGGRSVSELRVTVDVGEPKAEWGK